MPCFLRNCSLLITLAISLAAKARPPNVIVILTDDQGYQDLGCFGSPNIRTPNVDRMAAEGMRFTDFYVGAPVCTPSRAALLTGCYPERAGKLPVLFPHSDRGLNPDEVTIAELLKGKGYATACIGKWHLGHLESFLPMKHGFDSYYGIPYSNDMWLDPTAKLAKEVILREGVTRETLKDWADRKRGKNLVPLMRNDEVVEYPADQSTLTKRYTQEAVRFITSSREKPFFLYMPHTMAHIPLYASSAFEGKSDAGLYGDCIEEIDWSVGEILKTLRELAISEHTLVVYTSDNGPWKLAQDAKVKGNMNRRVGGSALPLRGHKFTRWEGGVREPTVMWWPGRVPAGSTCSELASTIDLLPTVAELAGTAVPADRVIDGKSIVPLLEGRPGATTPHAAFFYGTEGVRAGKWKLKKAELFDLEVDISEAKDVSAKHPEVVAQLKQLLDAHKADLRKNGRPPGQVKKTLPALPGWQTTGGEFNAAAGILKQTSANGMTAIFAPAAEYGDITFEVSARAVGGKEGFRMMARVRDERNYYRWSTGAFGNTKHSLMTVKNGEVNQRDASPSGTIAHDKWCRLKMVLVGNSVTCYVDDVAVNKAEFSAYAKGTIGLGSCNTQTEFKDLRVTDANGKVLLEALSSTPR